ncbi:MAG: hypothetical protein EAZ92_09155 [Candidatus Kapaibacterium sp.]|nr:MAG: hypothetical protein EAZ92_09155 [Candidatus Kapabacteria bacterium]
METLVYHLRREELNATFLDGIRSGIDAERITVVISPEKRESSAIAEQSLRERIEANRRADHDYSVPGEEFSAMVAAFEQDDTFDIVGALAAHKRSKP